MNMTVTISVPVTFRLPDGWQAVDPEQSGVPGVAFAAILPSESGPVPSITLGERERSDATTLDDIADEGLGRLVRIGRRVSLVHRTGYGAGQVPGLAQLAAFTVRADGLDQPLVQYQVFLALAGGLRRVLIETALTATPQQYERAGKDFGTFVSTIRLDGDG
jgi:hypothetical protein